MAAQTELRWHPDIDKHASYGNSHYFALVNNTPWYITITSGTVRRLFYGISGLDFTTTVYPNECYIHNIMSSKNGWKFSTGGTFCIKATPDSAETNAQFIDFAVSNTSFRTRKIHSMPVACNQNGQLACKDLDYVDVTKSFTFQDVLCVVKGEIHQGQNDNCVWKFCVQALGEMQ